MKWVGIVLKGREEMEAELDDIESRWGCRDVVIIRMILLTATRSEIGFSGTLKSLLFKPWNIYFAKFFARQRTLLASCRRILAWQDNRSMA
jgi:hypothetical protein